MNNEEQTKREAVKKAYSSQAWSDKVDKMSPEQVTAIYLRLNKEGKLG